jgi:hypothetical protein
MLTPAEYAITTPEQAAAMGLPPDEWGVLMCHDEDGHRVTVIGDASYVRMLKQAPLDEFKGLTIETGKFSLSRDGWPPTWE